jgi:dihydrofolate synthase/folylpolyglutamate synthase
MRADYAATLEWLYGLENMGIKLGIGRMRGLLAQLGDPQDAFASVHVAGSKGKGSTCAMLDSILRSAGCVTGLYTSPHLLDFCERITVNGIQITEAEVVALANDVRAAAEAAGLLDDMTFFEITTAMAFRHFQKSGVEVAVIEVGLGGALDATNVITPKVSVITRIDMEHTRYLGESEAAIAYEKAGIIKEGVPVVTGEEAGDALRVIAAAAMDHDCALSIAGLDFDHQVLETSEEGILVLLPRLDMEVLLPLQGTYQGANAALACEAALVLRAEGISILDEHIAAGLGSVSWPGRLQIVDQHPRIIFDVTHTAEGAEATARDVSRLKRGRTVLVLGILEDKDADGIAAALAPCADLVICTSPDTKRAMPEGQLALACRKNSDRVEIVPGVSHALSSAMKVAGGKGTVLLAGSFYTVGEGMKWLEARKK